MDACAAASEGGGMTKLSQSKPVTRETSTLDRTSPIVVTLHPRWIEIRLKGERGVCYSVPYEAIWKLAQRQGGTR